MGPIGSQLGSFILLVNWKWKKPNFGLVTQPRTWIEAGIETKEEGKIKRGCQDKLSEVNSSTAMLSTFSPRQICLHGQIIYLTSLPFARLYALGSTQVVVREPRVDLIQLLHHTKERNTTVEAASRQLSQQTNIQKVSGWCNSTDMGSNPGQRIMWQEKLILAYMEKVRGLEMQ